MSDIKWHYFPEEKPNYGDVILWSHCQALVGKPEVVVFDVSVEWIDGDRWAEIRDKPKRKPLPDGTLVLTEIELEEFGSMIGIDCVCNVTYTDGLIRIDSKYWQSKLISDVKAILYIAKLFNLPED